MAELSEPFKVLALKLQEAAGALSHGEIRGHLDKAVRDVHEYGYVHDINGDDKSGDVIYSGGGLIKKAGYKIRTSDGKPSAKIDHENAVEVTPRTVYDAKESAGGASDPQTLKLVESAEPLEAIVLREAKADYEIKLIAPGKGSSAFYPKEVLQRDGPKVFKSGTHVYLNHATAAEEAARPEGDVKNLAGVLTTAAVYREAHAKGPGLYARMKVFADHGQMVEEKAAHVGMSIRANGIAEASRKQDGLPVLKELTSAESVDVVTRAGAGGLILTEAARAANQNATQQQEAGMTADELKEFAALKESQAANAETNRKLLERALRADAKDEAAVLLESVTLPEPAKRKVIENVLRAIPVKDGVLDSVKLKEMVDAEAKRMGEFLNEIQPAGRVTHMGVSESKAATPPEMKPEEINARSVKIFQRLGLSESAAKTAVKGRAA